MIAVTMITTIFCGGGSGGGGGRGRGRGRGDGDGGGGGSGAVGLAACSARHTRGHAAVMGVALPTSFAASCLLDVAIAGTVNAASGASAVVGSSSCATISFSFSSSSFSYISYSSAVSSSPGAISAAATSTINVAAIMVLFLHLVDGIFTTSIIDIGISSISSVPAQTASVTIFIIISPIIDCRMSVAARNKPLPPPATSWTCSWRRRQRRRR